MDAGAFWIMRYTTLGIAVLMSLLDILYVLYHRLHDRTIMVYITIAAACEGIKAVSSLLFLQRFVDKSTDTLTQETPWKYLAQIQGYVSKTMELVKHQLCTDILHDAVCHDICHIPGRH